MTREDCLLHEKKVSCNPGIASLHKRDKMCFRPDYKSYLSRFLSTADSVIIVGSTVSKKIEKKYIYSPSVSGSISPHKTRFSQEKSFVSFKRYSWNFCDDCRRVFVDNFDKIERRAGSGFYYSLDLFYTSQ